MTKSQIRQALKEIAKHPRGVRGVLEDDQKLAGRSIVPTGSILPFPVPATDWCETLISTDETHAYIIMVIAAWRRCGALTRLIDGIRKAGLIPAIVSPMGNDMPAILAKWGWVKDHSDTWMAP